MESFPVYDLLKNLCTDRGITIKQLERDLDLSEGSLRKWRDHSPTLKNLAMVADYFGVSIDTLIGRAEDEDINMMLANPEYRALFKKTARMSKQDLEFVKRLIESIKTDE